MTVLLPEDRFILPTTECPNPSHWTSTDGDSTEWEVSEMIAGLVRGLQPDNCIETGTAFGQTARMIGEALKQNGHGVLHSIESDRERVGDATVVVGDDLPVVIHHADSLHHQADSPIDLIFFDSLYENRVPEFFHFLSNMRQGTVCVFHDTAPEHGAHRIESGNDLRTEIQERLSGFLDLVHLPTPRGITIGVLR